jgi:hypothetical protein
VRSGAALMARVYDASYERPSPSLLPRGDGIILYASRNASKRPTATECAAYRDRGVIVRFVFEDGPDRAATGGYADGHSDGQLTYSQVRAKGGEQDDAVYFACDTSARLSLNYARGFRDGLTSFFVAGLYAGDRNLELARANLGTTKLWQSNAKSWSNNWNDAAHHGSYRYASLYQVAAQSPIPGTDLNVINQSGWAGGDDDMTPDQNYKLNELFKRLDNLDTMAFNVNGGGGQAGLRTIIGDMRIQLLGIAQKVGAPAAAVDAQEVADLLVSELPPDLALQVADEIRNRLAY